mgnify:CR=1 FL=1
MASSGRSRKPLHPTNLHVNKALFPNDTVQSRLPDPSWLEHWLDSQIKFDREWEARVVKLILHNLSSLFELPIRTVQELSRYRKQLSRLAASPAPPPRRPGRPLSLPPAPLPTPPTPPPTSPLPSSWTTGWPW